MDEWLSNIEFRNIKDVIISTYFDSDSIEYREIKLFDKNDDVHIIRVRMDRKINERGTNNGRYN